MNLVHGYSRSQTLANVITIQSTRILAFREQLLLIRFQYHEGRGLLTAVLQQKFLDNRYRSIPSVVPTLALLVLISIRLLVIASKLTLAQNATVGQLCLSRTNDDHLSKRVLIRIRIVIKLLKLLKVLVLLLTSSLSHTVSYAMRVWPLSFIWARTACGDLKPWLHPIQIQPTEI